MANWNPNATATLGLEWFPNFGGAILLDGPTKSAAVAFDQTVSQAIGTIQVPNSGIAVRGGLYAVEVYDNETAVSDTAVSLFAVPNEDVTDGTWLNQASSNVNLFASIDDGTSTNTADYIRVSGTASRMDQRFNTGSLSLTGKRILAVKMYVYYVVGATGLFTYGLNLSGVDYPFSSTTYIAGPAQGTSTVTWTYNPSTGRPWTIAEVQALDTTDEFWIQGQTQAGVWSAVQINNVLLEVVTQTENRLAVGVLDDRGAGLSVGQNSLPVWNTATMLTPTGGTWTKDGTGRHLYVVRRMNSVGSMSIPYLDAAEKNSDGTKKAFPLARAWDMQLDAQYGQATSMIDWQTRIHPIVQRTTVPADSVDSIPYMRDIVASIYTGRTAEQEISGAAATTYGVVRVIVACLSPNGASNLDIKVKRRSDNVQLGGTYTLTPAAFVALPTTSSNPSAAWNGGSWRLVQVQLPTPATLAAATQYYIEFSSTTPSTNYWAVFAPDSNAPGATATYNGTSDAATMNGLGRNQFADIAVTLATVPTAPGSMTAALGSQTVTETVSCVTAISRADLSWSTTALGGSFLRYEIQRSEDAGATWADIAWVTVESVAAWKDYEAKRGVAATYRIRVIRTDGAFSTYTQAGSSVVKPLLVTPATGFSAATMFLVSNYNPTQNLAYEYEPARDYTFNEAAEQQLQGAYGRDYQLGSNPVENRGITGHWTFYVGLDDKVAAGSGWGAFTALRNLALAQVPYVCLLDHQGNRMYAQLSVPAGTQDTSGGAERYLADVYASEVVGVPYVVGVAA